MTKKVDIAKAAELRASGMSLQQVADELGCSLAWCKANLKGTKAPSKDKEIVEKVRTAGKKTEGVTNSEVRYIVKETYKCMTQKELETKVKDVKRSARRNSPDVLIRPYWMLPDEAPECLEIMLEYANEAWQHKEYLADKYRRYFDLDESFHNAVIYALTAMSAGENNKLLPQGLVSYGRQLNNIAEELSSRNSGNEPKPVLEEYETLEDTDFQAILEYDDLGDLATLDDLFPLD